MEDGVRSVPHHISRRSSNGYETMQKQSAGSPVDLTAPASQQFCLSLGSNI